jgi:hypothetical protein
MRFGLHFYKAWLHLLSHIFFTSLKYGFHIPAYTVFCFLYIQSEYIITWFLQIPKLVYIFFLKCGFHVSKDAHFSFLVYGVHTMREIVSYFFRYELNCSSNMTVTFLQIWCLYFLRYVVLLSLCVVLFYLCL